MLLFCSWICVAQWSVACGTDVDVGRNDQPELFRTPDDEEEEESGSESNGEGSANALALNCTESVAVGELSSHAAAFCDETPSDLKTPFARAYTRICEQRNIVRMMESGCAWSGEGKLDKFFRVLDKTDLNDRSVQDFSLLAAFSVNISRSPEEYLYAFYRGYDDPEFKAQLKKLDAFKLSNVRVDREQGKVEYSVEAQTSAATAKYRGLITVKKLSTGMVAIYDQAVSDKVVVKEQRYLILLVPTGEKSSVVMAVDDKIVEDLGNHQIAYTTSVKINKDRMDLTNAMARYKGEVPQ
jgi:hypothetical protein